MRIAGAALWMFAIGSLAMVDSSARASDSSACVVLISTDTGRGTGFVCKMGGTNYVVTNTHVLEGARKFDLRTLDNAKLTPVRIELANDRDLTRLQIAESQQPALTMAGGVRMGQDISVLGNSEGAGVITSLKGKVTGVGPKVMEVDAPFVNGNSGSPILDEAGNVVAVATYLTKAAPTNWTNQGTPFERARRFGFRLQETVEWKPVTMSQFYAQASALLDCDKFIDDAAAIFLVLRDQKWKNLTIVSARQKTGDRPRYVDPDYSQTVLRFCGNLKAAEDAFERTGNLASSSVSAPLRSAEVQFRQLPQIPLTKLRQIKWVTKMYQERAKELESIFGDDKWELTFKRH